MKQLSKLLITAALLATGANASILVTFNQPLLSGVAGDLLVFSGSIQNTGVSEIFLNDSSLNFTGDNVNFTVTNNFLVNVPLSVAGGATASGLNLFEILISPTFAAAFTTYTGSYSLIGGEDGNAQDLLTSASFSAAVNTSGVPEPSTTALMGGAALALLLRRSFRRRQA